MGPEVSSQNFGAPTGSRSRRSARVEQDKLDRFCEKGILWLVIGILVYSPLALGSVRPHEFVIVQWLTVAVLALWGLRFWINPKHRLLWPPVCWGVIAFMAYAVGRYLSADVEYVARQEMIKVLVYGFLFLAILHNLHQLDKVQLLGIILVCIGMVLGIYALIQYLTESDRIWGFVRPPGYHKRGSGTFFCPNHLAGYLEMLIPLGLAYTLTSRFTHVSKILLGYATLAMFTGVVVSISMGGWLSTILTVTLFFFWLMRVRDYRMQGILIAVGLLVIAVGFVLVAELSPNRLNHLSVALQGDDIRIRLWKPTVAMWQDHFWFGTGPGHFDVLFPQYRPGGNLAWEMQGRPEYTHNDYLNTLADWGLVGALLVLVTWLLFYWSVFRSWKFVQRASNDLSAKRSNKASFVMGGALGLLAILCHSFLDFNMHIPSNAILAVTIMALVSAHFRYATEKHWHTLNLPMRLLVTVLLLAGVGYLGTQAWQLTRESYWLTQAKKAVADSPQQLAALEKAFAIDRMNYDTAKQIGEALRLQSWEAGPSYRALTEKALGWFEVAAVLNPYDYFNPLRAGMCLHWVGRHAEAKPYFDRALKLDPNGFYTLAHMGWHYAQLRDWAESKKWLESSLAIRGTSNWIASSYLEIVNRRLAEESRK